jgi:transcriptional regulator with PAS, ATPase and Fis domain
MKIETVYKHFLIVPISHLPVVNESSDLVGLVSKQKLTMEMADLSLSGVEYEKVPEHFLDFEITESIVHYFEKSRTIPVINEQGQRVDSWEKPRFLAEFTKLADKAIPSAEEALEQEENSAEGSKILIYRYMEVILQNFPEPLLATDKEGQTTFYNEKFEKQILTLPLFKDSIALAEKYFKELNQDLISNYLNSNEVVLDTKTLIPPLKARIKPLDHIIKISTLKTESKITGFLYHFVDPKDRLYFSSDKGPQFPSLEEAFIMGKKLEEMLAEVEGHYIFETLKKNSQNISHAANDLGVPRSTLQNRMKQLKINEKFQRNTSAPIPRNRMKTNLSHINKKKGLQKNQERNTLSGSSKVDSKKSFQIDRKKNSVSKTRVIAKKKKSAK